MSFGRTNQQCPQPITCLCFRLWDVERFESMAQKILPHPCFLYCAQFHPSAQNLVVTGGFDCLLRVWDVDVEDVNGHLLTECEGHKAFVNALCFDQEGTGQLDTAPAVSTFVRC